MGASKPNIFNNENERFAKISDAFGSHWRIEIINFIQKNETATQENKWISVEFKFFHTSRLT